MTQSPPVRRAELKLHDQGPNMHNDFVSDIAFTPDGRRVAGNHDGHNRDLGRGDRKGARIPRPQLGELG